VEVKSGLTNFLCFPSTSVEVSRQLTMIRPIHWLLCQISNI